jgi:hypothetical protein
MISGIAKLFESPVDRTGRPGFRRLAVPHTFKPELSFKEAVIASIAAFLRIFLGSILFGFCGWYSLVALKAIRTPLWRATAALPMIAGFLLLFALLMAGISACVRRLMPKSSA